MMVVKNKEDIPISAKHMYLQVLRGDAQIVREIPKFYGLQFPFTIYTPSTRQMPLAELEVEDPLKVGSIPQDLLRVLRSASGVYFKENDLEYTKVRKAYDKERKSGGQKHILAKILTVGGTLGAFGSGLLAGNKMPLEGLFLTVPSVSAFIFGGLGLVGIFDRTIPKDLEEFARLNEVANNVDTYMGNIRSKHLHPNLLRDDYLEFF